MLGGNSSTEHLLGKQGGFALVISPLIHGVTIYLNNSFLAPFLTGSKIEPLIYFELVATNNGTLVSSEQLPSLIQFGIYFIAVMLIAILSAKFFQWWRERLLHKVILLSYYYEKQNSRENVFYLFVYKWLRYDNDWFNYFSGYHELKPTLYPLPTTKDSAKKAKRIKERIVTIWVEVDKGYCTKKYFGSIIDYSVDSKNELTSIMILPLVVKEIVNGERKEPVEFSEEYPALPIVLDKQYIQDILVNVADWTDLEQEATRQN